MKKILLLIPALNAGGAERVMVTLANEWVKDNDVTLMVFNDGRCFYKLDERIRMNHMDLVPMKGKIGRILSLPLIEILRYRRICKEIRNGNYDFVLSFCWTTNAFASIVSGLCKNENIIISERADPEWCGWWLRLLIHKLYNKPKAVVCQSVVVSKYFTACGFKNKLPILPNPVNFEDIPLERPQKFRREIVTVGRLTAQKNHKLLISAFKEISEEYPEYALKIYGIGPLQKELEKQIVELALEGRVELAGTKKRVMYEVNNAAIFVLSSDYEGFPNVLIEAMGTGMPVISSKFGTGVAEELIEDGVNGYLFDVGDKDGLIKALRSMLSRENEFLDFAAKNRSVAMRYRDETVAKMWMNKIGEIIERGV